jgi:hypothetical protein
MPGRLIRADWKACCTRWQPPQSSSCILAPVLIANEPMHASELQDRRGQRKHMFGARCRWELPNDHKQCNQDHRANLHYAAPPRRQHQ